MPIIKILQILSSRMIYEFIKEDAAFSLQDINKSEMRVFRTLNFKVGYSFVWFLVEYFYLGVEKFHEHAQTGL